MTKTIIATQDAPSAAGPYSQGTAAPGFVFVSGQLPINKDTGDMPETVAEQTQQSLDNIAAILAAKGLSMADVVKTTVFLTDMDKFAEMNGVYAAAFSDDAPARSAFQVVRLPKDALVEIECIAVGGGA